MPLFPQQLSRAVVVLVLLLGLTAPCHGVTESSTNFIVTGPDPVVVGEMLEHAERLRRELSILWLGVELPSWSRKCPIQLVVNPNLPASGETTFVIDNGEVFDWKMRVCGPQEQIADSVLPHEITHTIMASYFRRPIPRWADEGIATFCESDVERKKYQDNLIKCLTTRRGIALNVLFEMMEYPDGDRIPLYAQGYSVSEFLIRQRGPLFFTYFVERTMNRTESWDDLISECYGYESLAHLQDDWLMWIKNGSPKFARSNLMDAENADVRLQDLSTLGKPLPEGSDSGVISWSTINLAE